jgi:hypothetical protein
MCERTIRFPERMIFFLGRSDEASPDEAVAYRDS